MLGSDVELMFEPDEETRIDLLGRAEALINPIRWPEPFGLVMAESLACGTPVLASPHGAAQEIVEHGHTGFLHEKVDDLVEACRPDRSDRPGGLPRRRAAAVQHGANGGGPHPAVPPADRARPRCRGIGSDRADRRGPAPAASCTMRPSGA